MIRVYYGYDPNSDWEMIITTSAKSVRKCYPSWYRFTYLGVL